MMKIRRFQSDQNGMVSILSVVIFATIITVVVASYVNSVVGQQHDATEYDLSTRAYYAAESGVQDAVRALNADVNLRSSGQSDCSSLRSGSGSSGGDLNTDQTGASYTCQIIETKPTSLQGTVSQTENMMLRLKPQNADDSATYSLQINWSQNTKDDSTALALYPRDSTNSDPRVFTPVDRWWAGGVKGKTVHPVPRIDIISMPSSGVLSRSAIGQNVMFLNPTKVANADGSISFDASKAVNRYANGESDAQIANAKCYDNKDDNTFGTKGVFSCQATITLNNYHFMSQDVYLRLNSLYGSTAFEAVVLKSGNPVSLTASQATIDVTGKAGNTFKRVRQTVSIGNGSIVDNWPDAAVIGGDGICKLFRLGSNPDQFSGQCN